MKAKAFFHTICLFGVVLLPTSNLLGHEIFHAQARSLSDTSYYWIALCPGVTSVIYEGATLPLGSVTYFHFENSTGGDSVAQINVVTAPPVVFWATTEPICYGSDEGYIEFWSNAGLTEPYEFSVDGGTSFHSSYFFDGLKAGYYKIAAKDKLGCIYEKEIYIQESLPMRVETPSEVISCTDSVQLTFKVSGAPMPYTWAWQFGADTSKDSTIWARSEGTYHLTLVNECDTIRRQTVVKMEEGPSEPQFYVPNSFSPDGDGINDCFQAYLSPTTQLYDFQLLVFDRWGGEVFSTKDLNGCWDGTKNGKPLHLGNYAWMMKFTTLDCYGKKAESVEKGGVNIVK